MRWRLIEFPRLRRFGKCAGLWWHNLFSRLRESPDQCRRCGCELEELPAGAVCPECGATTPLDHTFPTRINIPADPTATHAEPTDVIPVIWEFLHRARMFDTDVKRQFALTDSFLRAVVSKQIPQNGTLADGTEYDKHGCGVRVVRAGVHLDFDYSDGTRIDSFGVDRLSEFIQTCAGFPALTQAQLKTACDELVKQDILISKYDYYILIREDAVGLAS